MEPVLPRTPATSDPDWSDDEDIYEPSKPKRGAVDSGPVVVRRGGRWRSPFCLLFACLGCVMMCCVLPICALTIGGATLGAVIMNSEVTVSGSQTLPLEPGVPLSLSIDNLVGDVTIRPGPADQVVIDYTKITHGWSRGDAQAQMDKLQVNIEQPDESTVTITVDTGRAQDEFWMLADEVLLTVAVPPGLDLSIETNVGKVRVEGVSVRGLDISTNVGDIIFSGALQGGANARYQMNSTTGLIEVRLPQSTRLAIDASSDVSSVVVSERFVNRTTISERVGSAGASWSGTIGTAPGSSAIEGSAEDALPTLTLRSSTGRIQVDPTTNQ